MRCVVENRRALEYLSLMSTVVEQLAKQARLLCKA